MNIPAPTDFPPTPYVVSYIAKLQEAADRGEMAAQYLLGMAYMTGSGVNVDHQEGIKLFCKSAQQEYPASITVMGDIYHNGSYGLTKTAENDAEALKWWQKSAELGGITCAIRLGTAYHSGECVPQRDYVQAWAWFDVAAPHNDYAAKCKKIVANSMTPEEVAEAEELAKELRKKIATEVAAHNQRHANYKLTGKLEMATN